MPSLRAILNRKICPQIVQEMLFPSVDSPNDEVVLCNIQVICSLPSSRIARGGRGSVASNIFFSFGTLVLPCLFLDIFG